MRTVPRTTPSGAGVGVGVCAATTVGAGVTTGVGSADFYGVAGALWTRGEIYFAEARVFIRGSVPEIEKSLETIRVHARDREVALTLLNQKVAEEFAPVKWLLWTSAEAFAERSGGSSP